MPSLLLGFAGKAFAIVDAKSTTNTSDPGGGIPWANVGGVNGASGEYLGNGWVLTANHVGAGAIAFDSGSFMPDGRTVRLTNPADGSPTDILLFHLILTPSLSLLPLSTSTPSTSSSVEMVGFGHITGSAQKTYTTASGTYTGFDWGGAAKSYGTNKITNGGVTTQADLGNGTLRVFTLTFSQTQQTADEGQVATGDSGGAIFYKSGTTWQLAGMIDALGFLLNQPANTAVYGDASYCGDIATYASQINAVVATPAGGGAWNGTSDTNWATTANWSSSPVPGTGNTATFNSGGNGKTTISLGSGVTVNTVLFDTANVAAYTIGGGAVGNQTLILNNGGAVTTSSTVTGSQTFNATLTLGTDTTAQTYTISNNGTVANVLLTFAGGITGASSGGTSGAKTLAVVGTGNTTVSGSISNGGAASVALIKSGSGTLILSGADTYTGGTTINGGTLQIGNGSTTGSLNPVGSIADNGVLAFNRTNVLTQGTDLTNVISGSGAVIQAGTGTTILAAGNTYTGTTTIAQGTLSAANVVVSGSASSLGNASSAVVLGAATHTGTLSYTGNSATYVRGFTVQPGGGEIDTTTTGQTLTVSSAITAASTDTSLTVGGAGNTTFTGNVVLGATTGTLTKNGMGTLNINSGTQTYVTLTDNAGTANVNVAIGSGGTAVSVNTSGTVLHFGSVSQTLKSLSIGNGAIVTFDSGFVSFSDPGTGGKAASFGGIAVLPEPGTLGLLLIGALGMLNRRRRITAEMTALRVPF